MKRLKEFIIKLKPLYDRARKTQRANVLRFLRYNDAMSANRLLGLVYNC